MCFLLDSKLIDIVISDVTLEAAYAWVCEVRKNAGHNNSIWDMRLNWEKIKPQIQYSLCSDTYHLSPLHRYFVIVLRLIHEYCNRLVWVDGEYTLIEQGIALGCPLSPLFGAWFLREMDIALSGLKNVYYVRYMDDWLVLAKTRNHLRKAIKITEKILSRLQLTKHPDKTFIGWIKTGFDFLGYHITLAGIGLSVKTKQH